MTGSCESVLYARQEIISQLPLVLMFDLKEDISMSTTQKLGEQFECFISIKSKAKQATKSCIIKSSEANVYNMFKARQTLMNLSYNGLEDIPMPVNAASFLYNQKMQFQLTQLAQATQNTQNTQNNTFLPTWNNSKSQSPRKSMQISTNSINSSKISSTPSRDSANTKSIDSNPSETTTPSKMSANLSGIIRQPNPPPTNGVSSSGFKVRSNSTQKTGIKIASIQTSNRSGSCSSKDDCISSGNECNTSDLSDNESNSNNMGMSKIVSESYYKPISYRTGPTTGCSKLNKNKNNKNNTNAVSGNVSSSTSDNSDSIVASKNNNISSNNNTNNKLSKNKTNTQKSIVNQPKSLTELFENLNLNKYIESFLEQEIDITTFSTMSDNDLREMGVNTFGARRKMSMAIKELNSGIRHHTSTANISLTMA